MIAAGAVMVFGFTLPIAGGGVFNGLWLILIGAFLYNAAVGGYRQTVMEDKLAHLRVRSVMQTQVPIVPSDASLDELLSRNFTMPDGQTMFVTRGQDVVGLIAMKDVKRYLTERWSLVTAGDIMTPISDLLFISADEDVVNAFERLQRLDLRHMPVKLNDRIVGLLHRNDLHRLLKLNSEPSS
jgi:predicted transcriptional regulator